MAMINPMWGFAAGQTARHVALKNAPAIMNTLGIGARALPQATARLLPSAGGRAVVPYAGQVGGRTFFPLMNRAGTTVAKNYGRTKSNVGSFFTKNVGKDIQPIKNAIAASAGVGGGGMIAGAVPDEWSGDGEFDVGASVMDGHKQQNSIPSQPTHHKDWDPASQSIKTRRRPANIGRKTGYGMDGRNTQTAGNPARHNVGDGYGGGMEDPIYQEAVANLKAKASKTQRVVREDGTKKRGPIKGRQNAPKVANPYSKNPFAKNFSPSAYVEGAGNAKVDAKSIPGSAAYEAQRRQTRPAPVTKKRPTHQDRLNLLNGVENDNLDLF